MYCIVNTEGGIVSFINTTNVGAIDTSKCVIYYIPNDAVQHYIDGKFYLLDGTEYTGEVIDVTNQYIDLYSFSQEITLGNEIEVTFPAGEYEIYYERTYVGTFKSDGITSKTLRPKNVGRYIIIASDKPCNPMLVRVYEQTIEII